MDAYEVTIQFDPRWILSVKSGGRIMDEVISVIGKHYEDTKIDVLKKDFYQCIFLLDKEIQDNDVENILRRDIQLIGKDVAISVKIKSVEIKQTPSDDSEETESDNCVKESERNRAKVPPKVERKTMAAVEEVNYRDLIGFLSLKKWIEEMEIISKKGQSIVSRADLISRSAYLISINQGNGLSTLLKAMSETLKRLDLHKSKGEPLELVLPYSDDPRDNVVPKMINEIEMCRFNGECEKGVVSINIEAWIEHLEDKQFSTLLKYVSERRKNILFIFVIPYLEHSVVKKVYDRIDDIMNVRIMRFAPLTDTEYFEYFKAMFAKYDVEVEQDSFESFASVVMQEKNDGKFYGFNTIDKIAEALLYNIIVESAKEGNDIPKTISRKDFMKAFDLEDVICETGIKQLENMVALSEVKNKVQEILSAVKFQKEMFKQGKSDIRPCFHMMFTGNPGTGKTVVARIIGKIFKEEGLLEIGNFYEVSRQDFIGKYVGHTAPKTMEICRNAYGSVLFIDEAYLLADERDSFSSEAIGTLIAEMENNRDKMVVIFAGYEKELEELFNMNPGLRDRIPYKINFPNYSRDELKQIFYMQLKNKVSYDESFENECAKFFEDLPENVMQTKEFSNGRFVRNLSERVVSKAALRFDLSGEKFENFKLNASDFSAAVADRDFSGMIVKEKHIRRMGFLSNME